MNRDKMYYWHELPGHNFRMTNILAAMGVAQLEKIDTILSERKRVYNAYIKNLGKAEGLTLQIFDKEVEPVVWTIALKLDKAAFPQGRDTVIAQLNEKKIESRPGFYAASLLNIYDCAPLPDCEEISKDVICLPFFPTLDDEDISLICVELTKLKR